MSRPWGWRPRWWPRCSTPCRNWPARGSPSCWWSRTCANAWRWPTGLTCWRTAALSWRKAAPACWRTTGCGRRTWGCEAVRGGGPSGAVGRPGGVVASRRRGPGPSDPDTPAAEHGRRVLPHHEPEGARVLRGPHRVHPGQAAKAVVAPDSVLAVPQAPQQFLQDYRPVHFPLAPHRLRFLGQNAGRVLDAHEGQVDSRGHRGVMPHARAHVDFQHLELTVPGIVLEFGVRDAVHAEGP